MQENAVNCWCLPELLTELTEISRNFLRFSEIAGDCRRLRYILENVGSNRRVMADMLENAGDCHCSPELFIIQDQYGKMTVFIRMCQNFHRFFV